MRTAVALLALAACGDSSSTPAKPPPEPPAPLVRADAAIDPAPPHLDDDIGPHAATAPATTNRPARPIDITLRSTPPNAQVAVDGAVIGSTPAYWNGMADGREHEFVFTLRGHAIARYRFVPITSGVIHPRLEPIAEEPDAGVLPPPEVVPHPHQPSAIAPPSAPPTFTPDAADAPPIGPAQ